MLLWRLLTFFKNYSWTIFFHEFWILIFIFHQYLNEITWNYVFQNSSVVVCYTNSSRSDTFNFFFFFNSYPQIIKKMITKVWNGQYDHILNFIQINPAENKKENRETTLYKQIFWIRYTWKRLLIIPEVILNVLDLTMTV